MITADLTNKDTTLDECGVQNEDSIDLTLRLKGGMNQDTKLGGMEEEHPTGSKILSSTSSSSTHMIQDEQHQRETDALPSVRIF